MKVRFTCTTYPHLGRIGAVGRSNVDRHKTLNDARLALEGRCIERLGRGYRQERS
jgi:hypothetical protein